LGGKQDTTAETTTIFDHYELHVEYRTPQAFKSSIVITRSAANHSDYPLLNVPHETAFNIVTGTVQASKAEYRLSTRYPYLPDEKPMVGWVEQKGKMWSAGPIKFHVAADNQVAVQNIKIRPLGLASIFNGKDLSGWQVFKGDPKKERSTFSVTKEGWLNIKDGAGDLQTEGQWGNFVLQFECISNGKHLNSGIFFRCRPGEYQQGYEAQVRNQFTAEPTQKYLIEEYDPASGMLKAKKEITSTAFDYGTGAIYRRMPARKEMSKDGEWFAMTVVAQGRHLSTWVNGVQVADWTDNRARADNARNGYRPEKGPISLQGHDPTTDLSFRNFRIAEMSGQ